MQKIRSLTLVATMLVGVPATAATVDIMINGKNESYTLEGLQVDSSGNATVVATSNDSPPAASYMVTISPSTGGTISGTSGDTPAGTAGSWTATPSDGYTFGSWGGACVGTSGTSCNKTVNSALTVSATFIADGAGGAVGGDACPAVDPTVTTVVNTQVAGLTYPRTDYSSVKPNQVYAFKFTTANVASLGNWIATKMSSAPTGKLVKITQCPNVLTPTNTTGRCEVFTTESTRIDYAVNRPDLSTRNYCHLQPGTVYYANVISKSTLTADEYNCGDPKKPGTATSACAFSMSGQ